MGIIGSDKVDRAIFIDDAKIMEFLNLAHAQIVSACNGKKLPAAAPGVPDIAIVVGSETHNPGALALSGYGSEFMAVFNGSQWQINNGIGPQVKQEEQQRRQQEEYRRQAQSPACNKIGQVCSGESDCCPGEFCGMPFPGATSHCIGK